MKVLLALGQGVGGTVWGLHRLLPATNGQEATCRPATAEWVRVDHSAGRACEHRAPVRDGPGWGSCYLPRVLLLYRGRCVSISGNADAACRSPAETGSLRSSWRQSDSAVVGPWGGGPRATRLDALGRVVRPLTGTQLRLRLMSGSENWLTL